MELKAEHNEIFTDDQIKNFADFFNSIKRVTNRLEKEGYFLKNNKLIPPNKK